MSVLSSLDLWERMASNQEENRRLFLVPRPNEPEVTAPDGGASIELRLGTWFLSLRQSNLPCLNMFRQEAELPESRITKRHFVRYGEKFYLHPRSFVLAATMEWIKLPLDLSGDVIGKSSIGRHGLVIATATGVQPGFTGCLTLEIANLGELPLPLSPGMKIGQLFLHTLKSPVKSADESSFACLRRPVLHGLKDPVLSALERKQ